LISASLALHLGAMLATVARPRLWPWTLGALVADHLLLTAAGLWPRSRLLGPHWAHLPPAAAAGGAAATTPDDGPEPEATARVLQPIGSTTCDRPPLFRAPAGLRNPFLEPVLARLDLRLTSWTRRGFDTVSHSADVVFGRLTHHLKGGDILLLHDGHAARTR